MYNIIAISCCACTSVTSFNQISRDCTFHSILKSVGGPFVYSNI